VADASRLSIGSSARQVIIQSHPADGVSTTVFLFPVAFLSCPGQGIRLSPGDGGFTPKRREAYLPFLTGQLPARLTSPIRKAQGMSIILYKKTTEDP
jgi:hypothetical protein